MLSCKLKSILYFLFNRKKISPVFAIVVLNSYCNCSCPYCYMGDSKNQKIDLPFDKVKNIIDELAELHCLEITFHGGEALLRDDIKNIIDYAHNKGLLTHLVTNGLLLEDKISDIKNIDSVSISLDGSREYNDRHKNYPGYFDKAEKGIIVLKKHKIKTSINAIIHNDSFNEIKFLLEFCKKYNIGLQSIPDITLIKNLELYPEYREELIKIIDLLLDFKAKGYYVLGSKDALKRSLKWLKGDNKISDKSVCLSGRKSIVIDYDGYVYPCFSFCSNKKISIYDNSISDAMKKMSENFICNFCINFPYMDQTSIMNFNLPVIWEYGISHFFGRR